MTDKNDKPGSKDAFSERAATLFNESVDAIDGRTRSRLNQGRQAALSAASRPSLSTWMRWAPAGATAAVAVMALILWNGNERPEDLPPATVASDFEILMDDEDLDMLEDLEFYSWMGLEEELDTPPDAHVG